MCAYFSERQSKIILSQEEKDFLKECGVYASNKEFKEKKQKELLEAFGLSIDGYFIN